MAVRENVPHYLVTWMLDGLPHLHANDGLPYSGELGLDQTVTDAQVIGRQTCCRYPSFPQSKINIVAYI